MAKYSVLIVIILHVSVFFYCVASSLGNEVHTACWTVLGCRVPDTLRASHYSVYQWLQIAVIPVVLKSILLSFEYSIYPCKLK